MANFGNITQVSTDNATDFGRSGMENKPFLYRFSYSKAH